MDYKSADETWNELLSNDWAFYPFTLEEASTQKK
tara:strand:- start:240 stop:341 length:102 start_codon:yes stop_codon:yes gene_type:complete